MKRIFTLYLAFIFISVSFGFTPGNDSFRLLQANLITGIIPDIDDAYGVAFLDINQDRYPDIYITCFRNLNRLLINNGGIIPFIDRTIYSGLGGDLMQKGQTNLELAASVADYDNDGLPDLFLAGWGKTFRLFKNLGNVRFKDVTPLLNLHGVVDANQGIWFDANNDGFLDLYITDEHHANRLLLNKKDGTFREQIWSEEFLDSATSQGALAADFDADGDVDLYVCNWFQGDYLLLNDGTGLFHRWQLNLPTLQKAYNSNSAVAADLDNDGDLDILVATRDGLVFYYENQSAGDGLLFSADTLKPFYRIGRQVYGMVSEDFNNDGWLDIFFTVNGPNRLYLNQGGGRFGESYDTDRRDNISTGASAADFDRDGDLDLLVGNKKGFSQIYLNPLNNKKYVLLKLIGVKSNRDAIGARVYLTGHRGEDTVSLGMRMVTWQAGYFSSRAPLVHVGSGDFPSLSATVIFPSGRQVEVERLIPGRQYTIYEYQQPVAGVLILLQRSIFYLKQKQTWYVLALTFLLILILIVYIRLSLGRYHFSTGALAFQFALWFTVAIVIFVSLYRSPVYLPLLAINGFSLLSLAFTILYAEKQRSLRLKRQQFRNALQTLSQSMLQIHDEKTLFQRLIAVLRSNQAVARVFIFRRQDNDRYLVYPLNRAIKMEARFPSAPKILKRPFEFRVDDSTYHLNVLAPIASGKQLLATIGLNMQAPHHPINREDLQLIFQIANQTAITLENIYYIEHTARLTRQVTEARLKEKYLKQLEETNRQLDEKNRELTRLFKELQAKESQLIHSEKMAALGQLVAGITHEINNPVSFIYANSRALETLLKQLKELWGQLPSTVRSSYAEKFEDIISDIWGIITDNLNGSRAIKELVLQLKNFSRLDQAEWKESSVVEGLETAIRLVRHQLTNRIEVVKNFKANPRIYCNPAQLNQVFVNLLINAIQAIEDKGTITIETRESDGFLEIVITDTGRGIPQEVLPKIFDPFFTTKDVNQGTGLGLSISYSIVQKHHGTIIVKSSPGKGAAFTIRLPLTNKSQNLEVKHDAQQH
ncbi:integral membrane sensor signal transduction histidine kinase [Caldithrix abyssi DSM 13497]|uniref:histidine kinase n=1 Tax=Caldithrix abyssi DSM 13497 TaxID=880073 RepID=H1XUJ8_CALAY|nr:FG-GAP-like repeat-containing protein [Caldithrix abyssi]APF16847.1 His Kinase A (phospho-acceptor) domain-containing protein [Caldithrix abyssi DSM 13497]EHO40497.1 integral membrane sensor signal transduction histidine kinase [Caldithrix abyssi DSM 13497]